MMNEIIFAATAILDLTFILLVSRLGKTWLNGAIVLNILLISIFGAKLVSLAGFTTNSGNVFYAVVFFATQLLVERYGKREGYKSILLSVCSLIFFILMGQLIIRTAGAPETAQVSEALTILFRAVPRIALASLVAYALSQSINVWVFDWSKHRWRTAPPWVRLNLSNLAGQTVDSILFFTIAFLGAIPLAVLVQALVVGLFVKVVVGLVSTPFFYASFLVSPISGATSKKEMSARAAEAVSPRTVATHSIQLMAVGIATLPLFMMAVFTYSQPSYVLFPFLFIGLTNAILAYSVGQAFTRLRLTKDTLSKNEAELKEAQQLAQLGSFAWDISRNHIEWSDELYKIFGVEPDDFTVTYEAFLQHVHPDSRPTVTNALSQALARGGQFAVTVKIVRPTSEIRVLDIMGRVTLNAKGKAVRVQGACRDMTEQGHEQQQLAAQNQALQDTKAAMLNIMEDIERAKAKDEAILASIGDGMITIDEQERIIQVNNMAERLLGVTRAAILGKTFYEAIVIEDEAGKVLPKKKRLATLALSQGKTTTSSEYYIVRPDKTRFAAAMIVTPVILSGRVAAAIDVFRDITHEKYVDQAKSEFVSLASHQLHTPLAAIKWYTEMLLAPDAGSLTKTQREYLNEIISGNGRMVDLVSALLNVSRIEMGTFAVETEPTNVVTLAQTVVKELTSEIHAKHQEFIEQYDEVPILPADPRLLRIIFQNLLSNAVRYTPAKGQIKLTIKADAGEIVIEVTDTGYGIPERQQDKIFTKLFRADNVQARETSGIGLGLYIVKAIVVQAGGKVWFTSKENQGTTFDVRLPQSGMNPKKGSRRLGS